MAAPSLSALFRTPIVPRKVARAVRWGESQSAGAAFICAAGNIALYAIGNDEPWLTKVGVSIHPYQRMINLMRDTGIDLRMCYIAEVSRSEGFEVEAVFHRMCRRKGHAKGGEWVDYPRSQITGTLRNIMHRLDVTPVRERGDTSDDRGNDHPFVHQYREKMRPKPR